MFKWLTILIIVLSGFVVVLLSLGYLLKENEDVTRQLKQKLEQQNAANKTSEEAKHVPTISTEVSLVDDKLANELAEILVANMTCQDNSQCKLVQLQQGDNVCFFATNTIGAALIKKLSLQSGKLPQCESQSSAEVVSCRQNICEISN